MSAVIQRLLASPVFEGDLNKTRQASLINMIGLTCLVFILIVMVGALRDATVPVSTILIDLIAMAVILQFLRWLRSGRVKLARVCMVVFGLLYIIVATASIGTIRTPTAAIFVFWVLMTGLLFGRSGILVGTATASLAVLGLIVAENAGWLHQASYKVGLTQWITFTALFGFTSGLTNHIVQGIESALSLAEKEIEQRRKTEASLKEGEQRYRTLVDWMPEPLVVHRGDRILFANTAALNMLGANSAIDLVGSSMLDRIHPEYRQIAMSLARDFADIGLQSPTMAQKLLRLDGTVMDAEVQSTQIFYGEELACLTSMHDITERKAIEVKLEVARLKSENASQAKSRFLASASHDLRQPAHALGMFVARLAGLPNDVPTRHLVDCMDASVRAMQDMLDGLFDMSRLDSEPTLVSKIALPIEGIFGQLRHSLSGTASDKGLRLRIRPSKAWVESNPDLLHRILLNLVNNAVRYTPQGSVLVACRPTNDGTQLRIEVRDSGIGIDAQHHEEIFQEFFQINNQQRDRSKGMGVGLSIVDRACRMLKHPLLIHSALGHGTRFTLIVPLATPKAGGTYEGATGLTPTIDFNGLRALLIEDDELGRMGLASLLDSWGCTVMVAEGAQTACDLYVPERAPDIIISDFRLGGGVNGIEAVDRLSALAGRRIAACLISGDTDANLIQQAKAARLTLLQKPVRPAKLRNLMRHLIERQPTS